MSVAATLVSRFCPNCHQSYGFKEVHVCPVGPTTEAVALVDPLIGSVLGERYKIENYVSSGGMGVVYKARHIVLDKPIAIKLLREAQDTDAQQRFLLEAKSACHIGHEHIVDITDFGVLEDGRPYLVMEFLVGKSLETVIREGPLPPRRVCRIGEQIARGLQAVHEKGILHRDLKPGNVFLLDRQKRDFVKILDFGIAKVMAGTRDSLSETEVKPLVNMRQTTQGTVLGTPEYLSPEQAAGEPIDARVDQYALGCILYEMLTGRRAVPRQWADVDADEAPDGKAGAAADQVPRAQHPRVAGKDRPQGDGEPARRSLHQYGGAGAGTARRGRGQLVRR